MIRYDSITANTVVFGKCLGSIHKT